MSSAEPLTVPETVSLFQQPWWLRAVAPRRWGVVEAWIGGDLRARMPYVVERRMGLTLLKMPPLTQTLGPWFAPSAGKYVSRLGRQKELMNELVAQLPPFDHFHQNLHPSVTNWLPLYWRGFEQTTRYTYRLDDLSDEEAVWKGCSDVLRNQVRKAKKTVEVKTGLSIERFLDLHEATFRRQGLPLPYSRDLVRRLDRACAAQDARRIFHAEDAQGRVHAAVYVVFDDRCAYYLMSGSDAELRKSGALALLLWRAIRFAATVTKSFDFEGSMLEPVERFFRAFGAVQTPYFEVTGSSRRMRVLNAGRDLVKSVFTG